jgi:hydroxyacylglutathione hydrolase
MRKAWRIGLGASGALVFALVAGAAWSLSGGSPIVDGAELAPGVVAVQDGFVTAFLVEGERGVVLVDCGMDPEAGPIRAALAARGHTVEDVRAILLTHGHGDHTGGCAAFPKANVFVHGDDAPLMRGEVGSRGPITRWMPAKPAGVRATSVQDDARLVVGGVEAIALHVPGHTPGSTAWLAQGVVFLGDAAESGASGDLMPPRWLFTDDGDAARASLTRLARRLAGTEVVALAPAHSGALFGAEALRAWAAPR